MMKERAISYFDTNIFSMAVEEDVIDDFVALVKDYDWEVPFSDYVLQEMDAIRDERRRNSEYSALAAISTSADLWVPLEQTLEFLGAVRKFRPNWLTLFPRKDFVEESKFRRIQGWKNLKQGSLADIRLRALNDPINELKSNLVAGQKEFRKLDQGLFFSYKNRDGKILKFPLSDLDNAWREDCFIAWKEALYDKFDNMLDYSGFAKGFLRERAYQDLASAGDFWFNDVPAAMVPLNRIRGLMWHLQLRSKVEQGNPGDTRHASYLDLCDLFFTADKRFFMHIETLASIMNFKAKAVYIDRTEGDLITQIARSLN